LAAGSGSHEGHILVGVGWKARCGGRKEKKKRWKKEGYVGEGLDISDQIRSAEDKAAIPEFVGNLSLAPHLSPPR